jgi:hypothetical protein
VQTLLEEDPTTVCLMNAAFSIQSNFIIAREENTIPIFEVDETTPEDDCNNNNTMTAGALKELNFYEKGFTGSSRRYFLRFRRSLAQVTNCSLADCSITILELDVMKIS